MSMNLKTDYTPGARKFDAVTENGLKRFRVIARDDRPDMGGEFLLCSDGTLEDGLLSVCAAKVVGGAGEMTDVSGTEEWTVIDGLMAELEEQGNEMHLRADDLEYFQVRARRFGYESAEEWLLEAILGDLLEAAGEDEESLGF